MVSARVDDKASGSLNGGLHEALSRHLRERSRRIVDVAPARGAFVLYWMRVAARAEENAALDVALEAANALGLPVVVYHAVSERYPYASDRHHTFILEGARDVACALSERGIAYVAHVERPGARGPVLLALAARAALVITEEMPMMPLRGWTSRLATHLGAALVPLWAVDASCVVPMTQTTQRFDRACAFRAATKALAEASMAVPWVPIPARFPATRAILGTLPFEAVDVGSLDDAALARLVAACAIDHGVAPVPALPGGSRAGYLRWERFREEALDHYARDRNDPLCDGTSRLSPYLHFGHVSALRLAREARARGGRGSDKYLDELLVWREAAFHYAAHTAPDELETTAALPAWARATLDEHASDLRAPISLERLSRGRTGDALWDAAQRSLLVHGELHNNVRMTWGKAILGWSPSADVARDRLVELNHRYALDGRDPASLGGLYWCLGLFDRPFPPARPVGGLLRPRPLAEHAARLDVAAYSQKVERSTPRRGRRVAVIGGGLAGLACARTLQDHGVEAVVFDKARAPGGRLTTRRTPGGGFDLGAQYFTARDPRFSRWVEAWRQEAIVAPWEGRVVACTEAPGRAATVGEIANQQRFVAVPTMGALARHLQQGLHLRAGHRVDALLPDRGGLRLLGLRAEAGISLPPKRIEAAGDDDFGVFDAAVVCLPAPQAAELLAEPSPELAKRARAVAFEPCFAAGLTARGLDGDLLRALPFDGAFIGRAGAKATSCLAWIARESSKPGREGGERWTLHATSAWSAARGGCSLDEIGRDMIKDLARLLALGPLAHTEAFVHRWAFARPADDADAGSAESAVLFDEARAIGMGGDWAAGGRVEGAFLSGVALAGRLLGQPAGGFDRSTMLVTG